MKFMDLNILLFQVIILFGQHSWTSYAAAGKGSACYSAIYSFGDSLADTGNLLAATAVAGRNLPFGNLPFGETYFGKATGRFSDGRLIVDYIAQASGLPFLDPYLKIKNNSKFTGGVNFAVAGATALSPAFFRAKNLGSPPTRFSLDTQIHWFLMQRHKFCEKYRGECKKHFANALFLMGEIGGNDYTYLFFQGRPMKKVYTIVPLVVEKIVKALKKLIKVGGAWKILVQNNLPMGCFPAFLIVYASNSSGHGEPLDKMGCMPRFNTFSKKGNHLLRARVAQLQVEYPQVKFVFADNYGAALKLLKFPQSFGLRKNVLRTCCGVGGPYNCNPRIRCGVGAAVSCPNPGQYFNWDSIHLTDAANGNIAKLFLDGSFTKPPLNVNATLNEVIEL